MSSIPCDKMTPKERFGAFLGGQPMDRLLASPILTPNHASRIAGLKINEVNNNGKAMAAASVAAFKKYRHDAVYIFSTTSTVAEAMGTTMKFPEDDAPQFVKAAVETREDVKKLKPADPKKDGRLPVYIEATERCVQEIGDEVFMVPIVGAPFTTAAALRGTEDFVRDLYRDPEFVHELLQVSLQSVLNAIDALVAAGGVPVTVEPIATGSLISEKHFREFALPYLKPVYERIHSHGLPGVLHICGKVKRVISAMAESGADVLSIDDIDMEDAKNLVGDKVTLMGNVKPAEVFYQGTPKLMDAETKDCIRKSYDSPKSVIVSSGCELPINTPPENVFAFMDAVRKYGSFPINL
ncbi:MAG: uroporphyrinogen decarboxylase family protein [Actinomycetota bacterium]